MDSGVKHRLSNVLAWMGFVALLGALPFILMIPGLIWEGNQEEPSTRYETCTKWRGMPDQPPLSGYYRDTKPPGFNYEECIGKTFGVWWDYKGETGWAYTHSPRRPQSYVPGYRREWLDAGEVFFDLAVISLPTWIVILVINYIFFGAFRALPWKRIEQAEVEG